MPAGSRAILAGPLTTAPLNAYLKHTMPGFKAPNLPTAPNGEHSPDRDEHGHFLPGHSLGGRPSSLTDELIEAVAELVGEGHSIESAHGVLQRRGWPDLPHRDSLEHCHAGTEGRVSEENSARFRQACDLARRRHADRLASEYERIARSALTPPPEDEKEKTWPGKDLAAVLREFGGMVRWRTGTLCPDAYGRRVGDAGDISLTVGVQVVMPGKDDDK